MLFRSKNLPAFKSLAHINILSGSSVLLWKDVWLSNSLQNIFPYLFSFAKDVSISVSQILDMEDALDHFNLPLSQEAYDELLQFQVLMQDLPGVSDPDQWLVFQSSNHFKVFKVYKLAMSGHLVCPTLKWLWKTCCQQKHKVFFGYFLMTS